MKYSIISINDDRAAYKERIRANVGLEEIHVPATNAHEVDINAEVEKRGLKMDRRYPITKGELGIWCSVYDNWKWAVDNDEQLVVFEDDAIVSENFDQLFAQFWSELPKDYDLMSLWVPENQLFDYQYDVVYDEDGHPTHVGDNKLPIMSNYNFGAMRIARVYQGYGNVAMLYSPKGAAALLHHAKTYGINGPVDCWIYNRAHTLLKGYAPKPHWTKLVKYDWLAETTVHNTERF